MVPLPSFSVPSQTAAPVRVAIVLPPLIIDVMQAIVPAILWQTRLSASLSLSARTAARNLFWADQLIKTTGKGARRGERLYKFMQLQAQHRATALPGPALLVRQLKRAVCGRGTG